MTPAPAPDCTPAVKRGALCVDESPDVNAAAQEAAQLAQGELVARGDRQARERGRRGHQQAVHRHAQGAGQRGAPRPAPAKPGVCQGGGDPQVREAVRRRRERAQPRRAEQRRHPRERVCARAAHGRGREARRRRLRPPRAPRRRSTSRTDAVFSGQIRIQLSQLIVSLWRASCLTKHFQSAKKGSDSFKPFAAGILYSLKRGLYLDDGTCVVPALEELAAHLPACARRRRRPPRSSCSRASHRGICSIQRALTSISEMNARGRPAGPDAAARRGAAGRVFEGVGQSKLVASGWCCLL